MTESPSALLERLFREGRYIEIKRHFASKPSEVFSFTPDALSPGNIILISRVLRRLGYNLESHKILSHASGIITHPVIHCSYARSCLEYGHVIKALSILDNIKNIGLGGHENNVGLYGAYARIYAIMRAFKSAETALARASEFNSPGTASLLALDRSFVFENRYKLYESEKALSEYLSNEPDSFSVRMSLGLLQMRMNQWEMAIENFSFCAQKQPEAFFPHYHLGFHLLRRGEFEGAIEAFESAGKITEDNDYSDSTAWGIGFSYYQMRSWEKALSWFRKGDSRDMVRACLDTQLGKEPERNDIHLDFPDFQVRDFRDDVAILSACLQYYDKTMQPYEASILSPGYQITPFEMKKMLEQQGLASVSFKISRDIILKILKSGAPVIVRFADFPGFYYAVISGYNSLRDTFEISGARDAEMGFEKITEAVLIHGGWAMGLFHKEDTRAVSRFMGMARQGRIRQLEKAEQDIREGRYDKAKSRLETTPRIFMTVWRKRLEYTLHSKLNMYVSPQSALKYLLKNFPHNPGILGFSAREFLKEELFTDCLNAARMACAIKAPGAARLTAEMYLSRNEIQWALRYNAHALCNEPANADLLIQRAVCYRNQGSVSDCFRFLKIAREIDEEYPPLLREIGLTFQIRGEYEKAEEHLKRALFNDPHDRQNWEFLVSLYEEQNKSHALEDLCQSAVQQKRDVDWSFILLGQFLFSRGYYTEVLSNFEEGLSLYPDSPALYLMRLRTLERLDELEEVENGFYHLLESGKADKRVLTEMGFYFTSQEKFDQAYHYLEDALLSENYPPALVGMARWHALQNDLRGAMEYLRQVLSTAPPNDQVIDFYYQLATSLYDPREHVDFLLTLGEDVKTYVNAGYLYEITDSPDRALNLYNKALKLPGEKTLASFRIAQVKYKTGEIDEARKLIDEILNDDLHHYGSRELLVKIYLEEKDVTRSMDELEKLMRRYPEHDAPVNLYLDIAETRDQWQRVKEFLHELRDISEIPERIFVFQGEMEESSNNYDVAEALYLKALQDDEFHTPAMLHMAMLSIKKKDYQAALRWLNRFDNAQDYTPESRFYRAVALEKIGDKKKAAQHCLTALEENLLPDDLLTQAYDLLARVYDSSEIRNMVEEEPFFNDELSEHFYTRLGEAYERNGDLKTALMLYEMDEPFDKTQPSFDAIIGMIFIARQLNDDELLFKIKIFLEKWIDEEDVHPQKLNPVQRATMHEAAAFLHEGERSLEDLKISLLHWKVALRITRTPWALERASFACLDLGEMTGDPSYFRQAVRYLRELRNPVDPISPISPALGDAYYWLGKYPEAVREYECFFNPDEEEVSLQPVFIRYLDALERMRMPVSDIMDLARRKLDVLSPEGASAPYRKELQERIFRNYIRTRQHAKALQTAIRSRGIVSGIFGYFRNIFSSKI